MSEHIYAIVAVLAATIAIYGIYSLYRASVMRARKAWIDGYDAWLRDYVRGSRHGLTVTIRATLPWTRPLMSRHAETHDGRRTVSEAQRLAFMFQYAHMSDGELLRLAHYGVSGTSHDRLN